MMNTVFFGKIFQSLQLLVGGIVGKVMEMGGQSMTFF